MIDAAHSTISASSLMLCTTISGLTAIIFRNTPSTTFRANDTEWGNAINFDGENSLPVRDFFLANVAHWITEYHFDGLRLDATQSIHDNGSHGAAHPCRDRQSRCRSSAGTRNTIVVAENEPQKCRLVVPVAQDGYGLDAYGTTISTTARWSRSPAGARPTSATIWAVRRNSSRQPSMAIFIRDSTTPGRTSRAVAALLVFDPDGFHHISGEPRSGRQLRSLAAPSTAYRCSPLSSYDCVMAAQSRHAHVLPRAGVWFRGPFSLFCCPHGRTCPCGERRTPPVHVAVLLIRTLPR